MEDSRIDDSAIDDSRIESLREMANRRPGDARLRFGLAAEYERVGRWEEAADELREYLAMTDDEGNAWGRLGRVLLELGHDDEARTAYERGIEAAERHGHPSMAEEFWDVLENW